MNAKHIWKSFCQVVREARMDLMLFVICFVPFIAGVFFRIVIPMAESKLCDIFEKKYILTPYYDVVDGFLAVLSVLMYCFASAMIVLEEKDSGVKRYMEVTPLGRKGYFVSHFILPTAIGFVVSCIALLLFSLGEHSGIEKIIICFLSVFCGMVCSFLIVSLAGNKVEGMAVSKLSGMIMLAVIVPYVTEAKWQYVFGLIPSYWIGRVLKYREAGSALCCLLVCSIWLWGLLKWEKRE